MPTIIGGAGLAAWKYDAQVAVRNFVTGPGRVWRILVLLAVVLNWKSLPFAWTFRVFNSFYYHLIRRKHVRLGPRALFKPVITSTRAPIFEIDYNMHKSNSTFFSDADVARSHAVCYLLRTAWDNANNNRKTRLVLDPKTNEPMKGTLSIVLGSVECSFRKEVSLFQKYEMWTSILSWDRKWVYTVTYFVKKGTAKPTEWLDPSFAKAKTRNSSDAAGGWERNILATSVAKYVFKLGRFTVHPAILLNDAGLLPERPGGWMSGEAQLGDEADLSEVDLKKVGEWDWQRVEAQRRKGYEFASQLSGLDEVKDMFDGGSQGALGRWGPG
ncbi:hypothetical protein CC79DRAFT_1344333 [Sarocladium strictum]